MMVKQFRKFKKFFKKADSVRRSSKGKPQVSDSPPESYLCYNCRKPGHWKSACPYPKKAMVAAESDESSSSSSDEEALICIERRVEKSNHEDRWTMSEDDTLCLMAKDDADQEVTSQTSCSSSYESIPTSENLFDQFKKMMEDFEEINLKHSSLTEENILLSKENLKLTEGRKSQLNEITQLKTENESLSEKVKSLNKELGILKSKEAVDKLFETTKHKGREGLGFEPSSSKRKVRTTFIPPKPTAQPNKQKGKEKEKPTEFPKKFCDKGYSLEFYKDMASLKNISTNEVILTGKRIRNIYEVMWDNVKEACLISKAAQELSEGPTKLKFEEEVLEFYRNGEVKTAHSKKDPQRTFPVIKSTVGAKKANLNNDYKLVLELVIACLECGSGGHADDITQERAFIINALITKSKGKSMKPDIGYTTCRQKGENRAGASATLEESSSDNIPLINLTKTAKRKQVVSPSISIEAPQNLALINLEEEEEVSDHGELQRKKKRKINSPSTSGNVNPDELKEKEPVEETSAQNRSPQQLEEKIPQVQSLPTSSSQPQIDDADNQFWQLYYDWKTWKISNHTETEIPEKLAEIPEQSTFPETNEEEQAVEVQRNSGEAEKETQMAELEQKGESERTLKVADEEDVQEDAESLHMQLFQRTPSSHQVTNFHFHSSSTPTFPDGVPEIWTKQVQGLIESALTSQHASFRQEIEQMEARYTKLKEKSEEKHSTDLKEISKSVDKTLEIISLLSETMSNTMEIYASDSQLQLKEINNVKEQIASVTVGLQKQMSLLQMDIRSALAVASANQVVTKDYLKVIIDNQKEAYKLFRLIGANSGNRKMEVILQQHSPSPIPQLPIAVKEGEVSYIPSHLNMTNLILEAQKRNPENSAQHLSNSGLDGTEFIGTVVDHFSNDAQLEERRENLRRIKELCGNMQGISEDWSLSLFRYLVPAAVPSTRDADQEADAAIFLVLRRYFRPRIAEGEEQPSVVSLVSADQGSAATRRRLQEFR
ncbi:unnamed protein product [Cuscuta campestris]|uniref:CCHC-type domain-containing protein n=1 Tax=Cuscuta campestris TaxID=132261 RepID=A0A484KY41_9ASTE|nr:unnamed protein product [Cuscuta campestris]